MRRLEQIVPGLLVAAALSGLAPDMRAQGRGSRLAAATENSLATRAALQQMQAGGNAVDAVVAAALVGGVASPVSSGIGGGGFALVWDATKHAPYLVDFREVAPQGIDVAAFEKRPFDKEVRGRYTGVPGEVAGLYRLHQRFGKLKWADLFAPAIRYAKNGFPVESHVAGTLKFAQKSLAIDPGIASVFFPGGKPAAVGQMLQRPKLAATLEKIAAQGPSALYEGDVAADIVGADRSLGGALTADDLKRYQPVERAPLHVKWEGYDVYTMPPPSAGGVMLVEALELYSKAELEKLGHGSGPYQHMVAEALRGAIADRMRYLGDPAFQKDDVAGLTSAARMAARRKRIAVDRTHALPRFDQDEHGTHHMVTADAAGNFVSLTTTVNTVFGAKYTAPQSGIVLNDEMDDFTKAKDVAPFGIKESPNRPRPGARPVSSMTPTIVVKDGAVVLALGGSGGMTIATNVTEMLLARLVFGCAPVKCVAEPRFYIPPHGASLLLEKGAAPDLVRDLEWRGEVVGTMPFTTSAVQMIAAQGGRKLPAADPRKQGSAQAW